MDIIAGMDWLRKFQPVIDWETSTLTVNWKRINFHIYPEGIDHLLKDYVFVKLVETETEGENTNYDKCE